MKTNFSQNDIWILRTLLKLKKFTEESQSDLFEDAVKLMSHINTMTWRNRATDLRDVYQLLRDTATAYRAGKETFLTFWVEKNIPTLVATTIAPYMEFHVDETETVKPETESVTELTLEQKLQIADSILIAKLGISLDELPDINSQETPKVETTEEKIDLLTQAELIKKTGKKGRWKKKAAPVEA